MALVVTVALLGGVSIAGATLESQDGAPETAESSTSSPEASATSSDIEASATSTDTQAATSTDAEPATTAASSAGTGDVNNHVAVINRVDGHRRHRAGHSTARVIGDTADNENVAYAYSSCTDCRTVAVATQIVLVMSDAHVVTTKNLGIAINENCRSCQTMAGAYQYVVSTHGIVHFTPQGAVRLAELRNQITVLARSAAPFPELVAQIDPLVAEMWQVVDNELVKAGARFEATPRRDWSREVSPDVDGQPEISSEEQSPGESSSPPETQEQPPDSQPSDSPPSAESPSVDPGESPSPSPSPSPSLSPSPSPTPTPTASPSESPSPEGG
ncbi:MAG: hypothetical protein ACRDHO_13605 [Actinomycetota bacterium]